MKKANGVLNQEPYDIIPNLVGTVVAWSPNIVAIIFPTKLLTYALFIYDFMLLFSLISMLTQFKFRKEGD